MDKFDEKLEQARQSTLEAVRGHQQALGRFPSPVGGGGAGPPHGDRGSYFSHFSERLGRGLIYGVPVGLVVTTLLLFLLPVLTRT